MQQRPPSQDKHRASPRPKHKQTQAVATPVSKKALEYAGPNFHHSPAPSNLPPPPFLSRSLPQRAALSTEESTLADGHASPLSFLFSAKQREDSLKQIQESRPPPLDLMQSQPGRQVSSGIFNMDGDDRPLSRGEPRSVFAPIEQPQHHASVTQTPPSTLKKSPWAEIGKPAAVNLQNDDVQAFPDASTSAARAPGRAQNIVEDSNRRTKHIEGHTSRQTASGSKAVNTEKRSSRNNTSTPRARKAANKDGPVVVKPSTAQTTSPKVILKRDSSKQAQGESSSSSQQRSAAEPQPSPARESSASTFRPLKKEGSRKPLGNSSSIKTQHARKLDASQDSEEELRQQAANLMHLLNVPAKPVVERDSQSPISFGDATPTSGQASPSIIESDLRRMLRLGA